MSDAIDALNKIVYNAGQRGQDGYQRQRDPANPLAYDGYLEGLLEHIAEVAGDSLEDHIAARDRVRPRVTKERVFKSIVEQVANIVDDSDLSDHANAAYTVELIQELLEKYKVAA